MARYNLSKAVTALVFNESVWLGLALTEGEEEGERLPLGDGDTLELGEADFEGERLGLLDFEGEAEPDGLALIDGLKEGLELGEDEAEGLALAEGLKDGLLLGDEVLDGLGEAEELGLAL